LDACHKAYGLIDSTKLSAKQAYHSLTDIEAGWNAAKVEGGKFEGVRTLLFKARDVANQTAAKYKANKLVPSSSTAAALKVAKECENFALVLKSYGSVVFAEFERAKEKLHNTEKIMAQALLNAIPKCKTGFSEVKKNPTPETYNSKCWQAVRGLGAQVALLPYLKAFQPEYKILASVQPGTLKDKSAVLGLIGKLEVLIGKIEGAIPK